MPPRLPSGHRWPRVTGRNIHFGAKKQMLMESNLSLSTDSSLQEQAGQMNLSDIFTVISEQSTARPGCIIKLDNIGDATNNWQHTQFLHVFQEGLIQGEGGADRGERDVSIGC
ncbi:DmX-like protein 2 [Chionoecetes opilio]|uniref:DmX-like protein 2 n=1 Tax=Chionoecetes opilio TaxID=41210 RepID=A0A8J4YX47_CHIOP|nr:DmX-like protein 2 [Chionoecetes opilio]